MVVERTDGMHLTVEQMFTHRHAVVEVVHVHSIPTTNILGSEQCRSTCHACEDQQNLNQIAVVKRATTSQSPQNVERTCCFVRSAFLFQSANFHAGRSKRIGASGRLSFQEMSQDVNDLHSILLHF